jgi:hypothetical protein
MAALCSMVMLATTARASRSGEMIFDQEQILEIHQQAMPSVTTRASKCSFTNWRTIVFLPRLHPFPGRAKHRAIKIPDNICKPHNRGAD